MGSQRVGHNWATFTSLHYRLCEFHEGRDCALFVAESQAPRIVSGWQQTLHNSPLNDWPNGYLTSPRLAACWSQTDPNLNPDPSPPNSVTFGSLTNLSMLQSLHWLMGLIVLILPLKAVWQKKWAVKCLAWCLKHNERAVCSANILSPRFSYVSG